MGYKPEQYHLKVTLVLFKLEKCRANKLLYSGSDHITSGIPEV